VDEFHDKDEKEATAKVLGKIYVTDQKYRLPACVDTRASVVEEEGIYTIYHFALENEDYYMNYGIYANGLLVETCSLRYMTELSNLTLRVFHLGRWPRMAAPMAQISPRTTIFCGGREGPLGLLRLWRSQPGHAWLEPTVHSPFEPIRALPPGFAPEA